MLRLILVLTMVVVAPAIANAQYSSMYRAQNPGLALPIYGQYGVYQGYYRVNPYNNNSNFYGRNNTYNGRYSPGIPGQFNAYTNDNRYLGNFRAELYQGIKEQRRAEYQGRHR